MGQIFNRLERLVRSMTQDTGRSFFSEDDYISDSDMKDAWEELNRFLDDEEPPAAAGEKTPPESLRQDYLTLGVPFGAGPADVRKAYREQLRRHHPDLHAGDPVKQKQATDVTQKIILAYRHIKSFHETGV